jgi:hypothetical protein
MQTCRSSRSLFAQTAAPLIVDDQLTSRKENRATLVLVGIVQVEFAAVGV